MAIHLNERARQIDFHAIAQTEPDARARVRAVILHAVKEKKRSRSEIADVMGVHRVTITAIIVRVNEAGLEGLYDKERCGATAQMNAEQEQLFLKKFTQAQKDKKGGRLTGRDAQKMLSEMGFYFKKSRVYEILHKLELSWVSSRSQHPKANEEAQESFKKTSHRKSPQFCLKTSKKSRSKYGFKTK